MSEFDEWMGKKCSVIQSAYGEEYIAAQEAWDFQQAKIDNLKAQLNNMEQCYIGRKKERDALQARIENVNQSLGEMVAVSENLHSSWYVLHDAADLCKAEGIDQCVSEINKALRGEL